LRSVAAALTEEPKGVARQLARGVAELRKVGFVVEYLEVREAETLTPVAVEITGSCRVVAAVRLGRTRLIDNMPIPSAN
jgi:pantoate--beta-alanine ligase